MPDLRPAVAAAQQPLHFLTGALDTRFGALAATLVRPPWVVHPPCRGRCRPQPAAGSAGGCGSIAGCLYGESMSDVNWTLCDHGYTDVVYEKAEGIARITINRPEVRNAFRPLTVQEMQHAFSNARDDAEVGVVILRGMPATWPSVPAATSACAATAATSATTACRG
jgi:hypothetical protein